MPKRTLLLTSLVSIFVIALFIRVIPLATKDVLDPHSVGLCQGSNLNGYTVASSQKLHLLHGDLSTFRSLPPLHLDSHGQLIDCGQPMRIKLYL